MKKTKLLLMAFLTTILLVSCKNEDNNIKPMNFGYSDSKMYLDENTNRIKNDTQKSSNYCSLTSNETFEYLYADSPFRLGSSGTVNFTKRFSYERNGWVENKITILGGRARLEGNWQVIRGNRIRVSNIIATNGMYDASRNGGSSGILTITCNGDIQGTLRDSNGNSKDILIEKHN